MSSSPIHIDPYETLGVPKNADLAAIRTAHRKLVLKYHPDRIKDPTEREKGTYVFQKVQQSYEILSDDNKRNRYDQEAKLAELRKEQMVKEPVRSASYPVRTTAGSSYDYRDGHVVEERAPKFFDDDRPYFEEPRTSSRKHQNYDRHDKYDRYEKSDRYDRYERETYREKERERKNSTAYSEKKSSKSSSGISATIEKKIRQSAKIAREKVESKSRDKERKREASDKHSSRRAYVEDDDSSSDSDTIVPPSRRPAPPKRAATYDERPRTSKGETPRKREEKRPTREEEYSDEWDAYRHKHEDYHLNAREYIDRSRTRPKIYRTTEDAHYWRPKESDRTTSRKGASDREGLRSGSDRDDRWEERSKSSKSRRPSIEVVESAPRIIPSMPKHTSAPSNLKIPGEHRGAPVPQRSATAQVTRDRREMPLPRSNTTPLAGMTSSRKNDSVPSKSSKLRHTETQDSGYGSSSPNTPEHYGTSPPKSSKHTIVDENEEYSRPHIVKVEPDDVGPRDVSPPRERERPTRPPLSTKGPHTRATRTTTYTYPSDDKRPNPTRQNSSRPSTTRDSPNVPRGESGRQKLFGQDGHGSVYPDEKVSFSQNYRQEDVNYASYRRHSADQRARDHVDQRSTVRVG